MQSIFKILHKRTLDQDYLKYCLTEIERRLNWKASKFWVESDYIKLAEIIQSKSEISISPHTLKRLFGKIKYNEQYNPQQATKDALSRFLDFKDWTDFVNDTKTKEKEKKEAEAEVSIILKKKRSLRRKVIPVIISVFLMSMVIWFWSDSKLVHKKGAKEDFKVVLADSAGIAPFTVPIKYDVSQIVSDSVWFDFDITHPLRGKQQAFLTKQGSAYNFTYQIPGYYHLTLNRVSKTLYEKDILVLSNNWDSYFSYEANMRKLWLDNEIRQASDSIGFLYYSPKSLEAIGLEPSRVFYVTHRFFNKFDIDGDNFELEARFKNTLSSGGISCYDFAIRLICENELNTVRLMEEGCSQFSGMKFGEVVRNGDQNDLSSFKLDLLDWNTLKIHVKQKKVLVHLNSEVIFEGEYHNSNGNIVGVENIFKGSGMLDYLKIKDLTTGKLFSKDF